MPVSYMSNYINNYKSMHKTPIGGLGVRNFVSNIKWTLIEFVGFWANFKRVYTFICNSNIVFLGFPGVGEKGTRILEMLRMGFWVIVVSFVGLRNESM